MTRPAICLFAVFCVPAIAIAEAPTKAKLLIAFSSYRERAKYPTIYFYEHDGVGQGEIVGSIPVSGKRSDSHATLSLDGRFCTFASEEENKTSRILVWDRKAKKLVDLPKLNDSPNAQLHPAISGDGGFIAFAAWNRPGSSLRWDVALYDISNKKFLTMPGLNSLKFDERMPAFSGNGRIIAYISNATEGAGLTDILLYDWRKAQNVATKSINSPHRDAEPSLSYDGGLIAFVSDRPGGEGGRDIFLYDRTADKLLSMPGLNSAAQEQTPSLSSNGRYVVFVSERIRGEGERDIFLYDRKAQSLLPTPGLNARHEDLDPCVIELPERLSDE